MSARKKFHNMAAMEEKDSCTHSKLKQKEPFPKKKKTEKTEGENTEDNWRCAIHYFYIYE